MLTRFLPNVTFFNCPQLANALYPTSTILSGNITSFNEEHPSKVDSPIVLTEVPIVKFSSALQPLNACFSIIPTPLPIITCASDGQE